MSDQSGDDGFALIEVLIAFVIAALAIVALYTALGQHLGVLARLDEREAALASARSHLELICQGSEPIPGETSGTYLSGARWRMTTSPIAIEGLPAPRAVQPMTVRLEVLSARGSRLGILKSVKLVRAEP